jgi:iron complex outermembrane receptor protein
LGEPGATVNIITKQPLAEWYASGSFTGGRFGFVEPTLDVSGPLTSDKALRFRLTGAYQQQDSFVDFIESQRFIIAPVLSWSLGPQTLLTAEGEYQELAEIYYTGLPATGTIQKNSNGKIPLSRYLGDAQLEGDQFPERTQGKVGYRLEHRFNEHVSLRHGFRTTLLNKDERDIIPDFLDVDERTMFRSFFADTAPWHEYYALTDLSFDFTTGPLGHQLLLGSDQRFSSQRSRSVFAEIEPIDVFNLTYGNVIDPIGPDTPRRLFSSSGTFIGVYFQDLITITPQLKLLAGVRYDDARQKTSFRDTDSPDSIRGKFDDEVFTPRVGLVFQPIPSVALYASYTESFNPVSGTTRTGSVFKPETGEQYEGGIKVDLFDGRITATLAGYQLTKQNILTPDPVDTTFSIQLGEQRSRGFEFDLAGEVLPGLRTIASYAYTDTEITKSTPQFDIDIQGNRPANVPKHTGSVWGVYEFPHSFLNGLSIGLGVVGVGKRPSDNFDSGDLPGYVRTDALIDYRLSDNIEFALNFKNT